MSRLVIAGFLVVLSVAGCSSMPAAHPDAVAGDQASIAQPPPPPSPPPPSPPPPSPPAPPSPAAAALTPPQPAPPAPIPAPAASAPSTAPTSTAPSSSPAKPKPPTVSLPPARPAVVQSKPPSAATPTVQPPPSASTITSPAASPAAAPQSLPALNLHDLEQRLRDTRAIGVFAKLSLKNQVDDLLSAFREIYRVPNRHPPAELRQRYDLLMMKVLSLLQDSDPPLASAIASSREAIWSILADPDKFSKI
jgi:hypothetical protein